MYRLSVLGQYPVSLFNIREEIRSACSFRGRPRVIDGKGIHVMLYIHEGDVFKASFITGER